LAKELTNHSLPEIGDAFGGRDHTTVLHDKSVMAGVIIRAGDMVIDGSVRGRLERLADVLQS
uniref:F0F1 ATP synthase subunit delta n=1 Tax=Citrobacter amalonaticus TaxID=35703 RepID=UPI001E570936